MKINLQVFEAPRGGSATLLVDGRGVQTYQFSSFPGDDRGYVKKDVTLPPGSHDAQLRVEINGSPKVIESSRMRVELEARDEVELHAEVRAGAFTLARFEPVERSP